MRSVIPPVLERFFWVRGWVTLAPTPTVQHRVYVDHIVPAVHADAAAILVLADVQVSANRVSEQHYIVTWVEPPAVEDVTATYPS